MACSPVAEPAPSPIGLPRAVAQWRRPLIQDIRFYWGLAISPSVFFGQIHQESRWQEGARSAHGALGLAQFIPGTAALMQQGYNAEFRALCRAAGGCPLDGRWAIRALVLYDRELWRQFPDTATEDDRWGFTLASYNGGRRHIQQERRACAGDCDRARYFGHVQSMCGSAGRAPWACRENQAYPTLILRRWAPAYRTWVG